MRLEGNQIYLRPITEGDTGNIVRWRNLESVSRYFLRQEEMMPEIHQKWLKEQVFTGKTKQFIICEKNSDKPLGSTYLKNIDYENKNAEYGIYLGEEEFKGKGIGTETGKLIVEYGFQQLALHKIMLRVLTTNERAIASYRRIGFQQEGYLRDEVFADGAYCDMLLMAIFAE